MDWLLGWAESFLSPAPRKGVSQYLGMCDSCYLGYAAEKKVRNGAASGGVISALLIYLLEQGAIQGALVSRVRARGGKIRAEPFIAKTPGEILRARSSIYMEFPWMRETRQLLESFGGSLAVVGLPCQIRNLRRLESHDGELARKVRVHVALVCGRSSSKELLVRVLEQEGVAEEEVVKIRFREGHWRGKTHVWLRDGSEVIFPFVGFSLYRNLHFYCQKRCLRCDDPLAEHAEIVCGDAWLHELRNASIKCSLVICRTPELTRWIRHMKAEGVLIADPIPPETVFNAQRRVLIPAKRGKEAKARLGRLFGYRMCYEGSWRSRWNDYLMAAMVLFNYRWSSSDRLANLIFHIPRPMLKMYLVILSLLKNF